MAPDTRLNLRAIGTDLVLALLVTGFIYAQYWNGSPPEFVTTAGPVISVGGGVLAGIVAVYVDTTPKYRRALNDPHVFAVVMGALLLVGFTLFEGVPPLLTVLIVAFAWTNFALRALFVHRGG